MKVTITKHARQRLHERVEPLIDEDPVGWAVRLVKAAHEANSFSRKPPKWACPIGWRFHIDKWLERQRQRDSDGVRYLKVPDVQALLVIGQRPNGLSVITVIVPSNP